MKHGVLSRYKDYLPVTSATPMISLGEGDTPLVACSSLEKETGCSEIYFKIEGSNPTGSFKDRGMVVAIAKALEAGSTSVMCASTGNTSASASAYAVSCGLTPIIIVPQGNIAPGKMAQAIVHGAKIVAIDGNFDQALKIVRSLTDKHPITLVNSVNPDRIEGQKTAAFEIVDDLGDAPDYLFLPVGNAGNITAYWKGFVEYHKAGKSTKKPVMMGMQAEGAAPIVRNCVVEQPQTIATAIRIGNPASWQLAVNARDESDGTIDMVSDDEIVSAHQLMATKAGIFSELASAASLAGLIKMHQKGMDFSGKKVVCVLTGTGLKDTEAILKNGRSLLELPADLTTIEQSLGWG